MYAGYARVGNVERVDSPLRHLITSSSRSGQHILCKAITINLPSSVALPR